MIPYEKLDKVPYGGDYNPEQWPEEIWQEDMRLLPKAGVDIVTLNVFSWAALQPSEESYDFEKLDRIMEMVTKHDMKICMATSTGAHPAWMCTMANRGLMGSLPSLFRRTLSMANL